MDLSNQSLWKPISEEAIKSITEAPGLVSDSPTHYSFVGDSPTLTLHDYPFPTASVVLFAAIAGM